MKQTILSIIFAITLLAIMPFCMAESSFIFKQGDVTDLKISCFDINNTYCSSTTNCSITIYEPNMSVMINNDNMTWNENYYNYSLDATQTEIIGKYSAVILCKGSTSGYSTFNFEITGNGKPDADGSIKVLFIIATLILLGLSTFIIMYDLGHFFALDFDIIDVAFNWGIYFAVVALYGLEVFYLGNSQLETYLMWFIKIGGFVIVFMPLMAMVLSMTVGTLKNKGYTPQIIAKPNFRRQRI
jgi:hypothetical protein